MAKFNLEYYESSTDEVYSDGDIEYELLQFAKSGECDWYGDGRWPIVYHMSHLRHNILNWFPFKKNCTILEIGAGCGALTGLLCERASKVVAVELTKRRAEVNFQRHQHYDNLEIVVCDFQSIPSKWKYDYIIINGVLEYAAYMVKSSQPYEDFLKISADHMNAKGRMLLAIENRLGLKYFSGAKEDHTGKYFSGINGYVDGEKVKTFSKEELNEQISKAQLYPLKFYYPYPDYKFPAEIFSDSTIDKMKPSVPNYPLDMLRTKLFEEGDVYQSLMKMGVMDKFSNSFLVEIAADPNEVPSEMAYVKISANRSESFRICTYFDENNKNVHKQALWPQGVEHLNHMKRFSGFDYYNDACTLKNTGCQEESKGLSFPYITGDTLEDALLDACNSENAHEFNTLIQQYRDALFADIEVQKQPYSQKFEEVFGARQCQQDLRWTDNANVDMISGNIFMIENGYQVIDYEWHIPCKVPQEFVIWRMLKQLVDDHSIKEFLTKPMLYAMINIDEQTEECFSDWEAHFAREYVGIKDLYYLAKDVVLVDVEQAAIQQMKEKMLQSTLFFDLGNGFTDVNYERCQALYTSTGFTVTFSQDKLRLSKVLRWDPLEGSASCIQIQKIETDGIFTGIIPVNAEKYIENEGYEFFTFDPQFQLTGDFSKATYLRVSFSCSILDWTQGYRQREEEINLYRQKIEEQTLMNQHLQAEIKSIREISVGIENQLDIKSSELFALQMELSTKQEELQNTQNDLLITQTDLQNTQNDLFITQTDLLHVMTQMKEHRMKTILKVLIYGGITRGKSGE